MSINRQKHYEPWVDRHKQGALFSRTLHMDWPLLAGLLILSGVGLIVLYSASGQDLDHLWRQAMRLGLAFGVMIGVAQIPPHHIERWTPWLFGAGILMLLAVEAVGDISKGAQRWLDLGIIRFQPSELMKLAVPMMVAWYLAETRLPPSLKATGIAAVLIFVPVGLIAMQPDLGTSLLVCAAGVFVVLLSGISWRFIGITALLGACAVPLMWLFGMHDYQRQRVLTFLDPGTDPLGTGYHIIQSMIAIGSGGLYGKGWLNGTQSQLDFIPERSTDFIFAVFAEEFGFLGILVLLAIYLYIVVRGLYVANQAQNSFTRLLAGSLTITFFVYVAVNIGMVSGLLPVVGVPLPLISYGGTSMITLMTGFGILMSIQTHRKLVTT
jgi:rod shape determining protein RodA